MKTLGAIAALLLPLTSYAGYINDGNIWKIDGKIPVKIEGFTTEETSKVKQGLELFQMLTPVRVVHPSNDAMYYDTICSQYGCGPLNKYIVVKKGQCNEGNLYNPSSYGLVTISASGNCLTPGYISGQLGRATGLRSEHQRPDRNSYVRYNIGNVDTISPGVIKVNMLGNTIELFVKTVYGEAAGQVMGLINDYLIQRDPLEPAWRQYETGGGTAVGAYDYCSFTHFAPTQFSTTGKVTLQPLQTPGCYVYNDLGQLRFVNYTGQRSGLSQGDAAAVAAKYPLVQRARPLVYLNSSFTRPASNVVRFTVASTGSHPVSGYVAATNWTLRHTPSCQIVSGGSGAPGCLYGTSSYVREISRSANQFVFEIVNDRGDASKVDFTLTDTLGRSMTDTIDVRR